MFLRSRKFDFAIHRFGDWRWRERQRRRAGRHQVVRLTRSAARAALLRVLPTDSPRRSGVFARLRRRFSDGFGACGSAAADGGRGARHRMHLRFGGLCRPRLWYERACANRWREPHGGALGRRTKDDYGLLAAAVQHQDVVSFRCRDERDVRPPSTGISQRVTGTCRKCL